MRLFTYIAILVIAFTSTSCSIVKSIYNNAPEALTWWLDDYLDFTKAQKAVLNPALHRIHDWHKQHQLPEYVARLNELTLLVNKDTLTASEVCHEIDQVKSDLHVLQLAFIPAIIQVAPMLSDAQLLALPQKLTKRAHKWRTQWWQESTEAQIAARVEKTEEFAAKVYGKLTPQQRGLIRKAIELSPLQPHLVYEEILRRNDDIQQIISALRSSTIDDMQKSNLIKAGFARLQTSPNMAYQGHVQQVSQHTCEMIAELHASTDAKQKRHASDWFGHFAKQFTSLTPPHS